MRFKFDNDLFTVEMNVLHRLKDSVLEEALLAHSLDEKAISMLTISVDGYPAGTVLVLAKCDMDRGRIIDALGLLPLVIEKERYTMAEEFEAGN